MAGVTTTGPSQSTRTRTQSSTVKMIALALLALIVLIGLIVLITWLVLRPKKLEVSIDEASIHNYNLTSSKLNSTFDFTIRVYNPNRRVSVYHDTMRVTVFYKGQLLATEDMEPFFQGHKNLTRVRPEAVAHNVVLDESIEKPLKWERTGSAVNLDVRVNGKIRFRVGIWKSRHYKLKVKCAPVVVFSDPKKFRPMICDVDI